MMDVMTDEIMDEIMDKIPFVSLRVATYMGSNGKQSARPVKDL
jgi:hypothetical protein